MEIDQEMVDTKLAFAKVEADLANFTGTEFWHVYDYPLLSMRIALTDGVEYLVEKTQCQWLVDTIVSHLALPVFSLAWYQAWTLEVSPNQSAVLSCHIDGETVISEKIIETTFPLSGITLVVGHDRDMWVICLPTED